MILGVLEIAGRHVQQIKRDHHVGFGHLLEAGSLHQAHGGFDDRFRRKSVNWPVFKTENVANKVEGADLAATIGQELVAPYRALQDLVEIFGPLGLSVNLGAFIVFEFAQDNPRSGKLAEFAEHLRPAARMCIGINEHVSPLFGPICRGLRFIRIRKSEPGFSFEPSTCSQWGILALKPMSGRPLSEWPLSQGTGSQEQHSAKQPGRPRLIAAVVNLC